MQLKEFLIIALAITVIGTLAGIAIAKGLNGAVYMSSITLIAGIAGYEVGKKKKS